RDGMTEFHDARIPRGTRERHGLPSPAHGAHRVPDTEEVDTHFLAEGVAKLSRDVPVVERPIHLPGESDHLLITLREQADLVEHAGEHARGVRAPAESE